MKLLVRIIGFATFLVMFILAALFFKERTLSFDIALQDFYIILRKTAFVYLIRPGDILHQIPPLLLRWLNCPTKQILMAHSLAFVLFYFTFFTLISFWLKNHWTALTFILFLVLTVNDTFYWIPSEIPQGIAFLLLYYAYLEKKKISEINRHTVLHFFIVLFIQFYHPLMIAPILFVLLYTAYKQHPRSLPLHIKLVLIAFLSFSIRYQIGKSDWYEASKLDLLTALKENAPHFLQLPSTQQLFHFNGGDYLCYWVILSVTVAMLIVERRFYLLAGLMSYTGGYVFLVCVANAKADKFYIENMLLATSVFLLLPFTDHVLKKIGSLKITLALLLVTLITTRLIFIYNTHTVYTRRLDWYNSVFAIMDKDQSQRIIIRSQEVPLDTMIMTWASGYESLLLSSINGPDKAKSVVICDDLNQMEPFLNSDTLLLPRWEAPSNEVRKNYFNMKPGRFVIQNK